MEGGKAKLRACFYLIIVIACPAPPISLNQPKSPISGEAVTLQTFYENTGQATGGESENPLK